VDDACTKHYVSPKRATLDRTPRDTRPFICGHTIGEAMPSPDFGTISDYWLISGHDTVVITSDTTVEATIYVIGDGVLIVDGAMLTLRGSIGISDNGMVTLRDGAHLHFDQFFVGQYYVYMLGGRFEAYDATIDANGVMHFAELHNNSVYIAERCYFPDWTFRRIYDNSVMMLEDVHHVGDFLMNDSVYVSFLRCDTLMPWFYTPPGSHIDIEFPPIDFVEHFEMSEGTPGVDGIGYTFVADSCRQCWWSLENFPGCTVVVRNSDFYGTAIRMTGADTFSVSGIENSHYYADLVVPLPDRHLEFINTTTYWWNWYPMERMVFFIDSCWFGEMIGKDSSNTFAMNCLHDGWTIVLSTIDDAFMSFDAGSSEAYITTFQRSTMFISNSHVVPLRPYQKVSIAHDHSNILCVNCEFDTLPFAMDTAMVMFAAIDSLTSADVGDTIPITGSAWLDTGPFNTATFERYRVYWAPADTSCWTLIIESLSDVFYDTLAIWDTEGMAVGEYALRLTIWDSDDDSLTAMRNISLNSMGVPEEKPLTPNNFIEVLPNPFNSSCRITVEQTFLSVHNGQTGMSDLPATVEIFDVNGRNIANLPVGANLVFTQPQGDRPYEYVWRPDDNITSGVYLVRATVGDKSVTKRIVYLK